MLTTLANFAFDNAPLLCESRHGCQDYHRIWGLARIARDHAELSGSAFFHKAINEFGSINAAPRILVAGGADHG
ncbi:MAG: hypothetical protein RL120_18855, partial [Gammaproteobacteria bacterium]